MKRVLIYIAVFAGGALAGAGASFLVGRQRFEDRVQEAAAERVEAVRAMYKDYISKKKEDDDSSDAEEDTANFSEGRPPEYRDYSSTGVTHDTPSYAKRVSDLEYGKPPEDDYYEVAPYLVSEEKFSEERLNYNKIELQYYEPDQLLMNEDDDALDISQTIGYQCLDEFRKDDDLNEIFVRNDRLGQDFYVVRNRSSYGEVM